MTPELRQTPPGGFTAEDLHVLIAIKDRHDRERVTKPLLDAGFRVSTAATYGVVEILLAHSTEFDLLVTVQSFGEMGQFGLPQLARSVQPALPIVVLECEASSGDGVINAVRDAIRRWPLRLHPEPILH